MTRFSGLEEGHVVICFSELGITLKVEAVTTTEMGGRGVVEPHSVSSLECLEVFCKPREPVQSLVF